MDLSGTNGCWATEGGSAVSVLSHKDEWFIHGWVGAVCDCASWTMNGREEKISWSRG